MFILNFGLLVCEEELNVLESSKYQLEYVDLKRFFSGEQ